MRNLLQKLQKIGERAEMLHSGLNSGGCCVYASKVVDLLTQHKVKAWGVATDDLDGRAAHHVLVGFKYRGKTYLHDSGNLMPMPGNGAPDPAFGYPLDTANQIEPDDLRDLTRSGAWGYGWQRAFYAVDTAIKSVLESKPRRVKA